jgi:hypothetical protein
MGRISELMRAEIAKLIADNRAKEKDEAKSSAQSLRDALAIGFGNADPAKFCLERFLSATGKDWRFDIGELFADDMDDSRFAVRGAGAWMVADGHRPGHHGRVAPARRREARVLGHHGVNAVIASRWRDGTV